MELDKVWQRSIESGSPIDVVSSLRRGYIEAIKEIEQQLQSGNSEAGFDDIVVECGRWVSLNLCLKLERTIEKKELLVLSTLKWRMQAVTPFSFIDNFLRKINAYKVFPRSSIFRSTQLILSIIKDGFVAWTCG
ncbi:hypothetical protein ACSBR1_037731 [Camellia fascicularis]